MSDDYPFDARRGPQVVINRTPTDRAPDAHAFTLMNISLDEARLMEQFVKTRWDDVKREAVLARAKDDIAQVQAKARAETMSKMGTPADNEREIDARRAERDARYKAEMQRKKQMLAAEQAAQAAQPDWEGLTGAEQTQRDVQRREAASIAAAREANIQQRDGEIASIQQVLTSRGSMLTNEQKQSLTLALERLTRQQQDATSDASEDQQPSAPRSRFEGLDLG